MIIGIIDLGSNTIRLSIYKYDASGFKLLTNKKTMAGIISYIDNGYLSDEGLDKICHILDSYKELLRNFDIHEVRCFSTASLRLIKKRDEVLEKIAERTGIHIDLISGLKEAELDFIGTKLFLDIHEGIVIDIGGGSMELVSFMKDEVMDSFSLPIGSLSMYNRHVKGLIPTKKEKDEIKKDVISELDKIKNTSVMQKYFKVAVGVGGTIRATLRLLNAKKKEEANYFKTEDVKELLDQIKDDNKESLSKILKICPDRIHTIVPGMTVLYTVLKKADIEKVIVSRYGVREGYLYNEVIKGG